MITLIKTLYVAEATATGGRTGHAKSSDGLLSVALRSPVELGGTDNSGTNPEQLFAAGYAACFQGALAVAGRRAKVDTSASLVAAKVTLGTIEGGAFGLAVELQVTIPGLTVEQAHPIVEAAHQVCPYSNATRGNIEVKLTTLEG